MQNEPTVPEVFVEHSSKSESEIRALLNEFTKAIQAGDGAKILSFYSEDLKAFDIMPPLAFTGKSEYRKVVWEDCFLNVFEFPVSYEYIDLRVHADGDVAFAHTLIHAKARMKSGESIDNWVRSSLGLQRVDGHWLITHEHNSVPIDKDMKALMDLSP